MRYPADHREKTRQRILDAAGIVFRRKGFQAGSVDDVMTEAGLTAGAFYSHFKSKEELFAESFIDMLQQSRTLHGRAAGELQGFDKLKAIIRRYLSPEHRAMIEQGCPMPPLLADLPRQSDTVRHAFQTRLSGLMEELGPLFQGEASRNTTPPATLDAAESQDQVLALLALLVGGLTLSRAVPDPTFGDRILAACRDQLENWLPPAPIAESTVPQEQQPVKHQFHSAQKRKS